MNLKAAAGVLLDKEKLFAFVQLMHAYGVEFESDEQAEYLLKVIEKL